MACSYCDGHVGCIVWLQIADTRKILGMPSRCLSCSEVAISQRIHLCEGKSASDHRSALLKFQRLTRLLWAGTFCLRGVMREGRCCDRRSFPRTRLSGSQLSWPKFAKARSGLVPTFHGERKNWLLHLGRTAVQGCCMLPRSPGSHRQEMFCCNRSWHVGSWSRQHTDWVVGTLGWPLVWIASVEVSRR